MGPKPSRVRTTPAPAQKRAPYRGRGPRKLGKGWGERGSHFSGGPGPASGPRPHSTAHCGLKGDRKSDSGRGATPHEASRYAAAQSQDQALSTGPTRDHSEPAFGQTNLGLSLANTNVRGDGKFQSATQRMAIDGGNDRRLQARKLVEYPVAGTYPALPHVERRKPAPCGDVTACAEGLTVARQYHRTDRAVGVDHIGVAAEQFNHAIVERVELLGSRQGDGRDAS